MEYRKKHLKTSRRTMTRRNAYNHGRSFKTQSGEKATISNCSASKNNQRNHGSVTSATSSSTSMRAFNFNVDSLGRNQNFVALPKESTDRRIVNVQGVEGTRAPLYKNPSTRSLHLHLHSVYLLGGVNYDLGLERSQANVKLTLDYLKYFKKVSDKSAPSDRDVVFGNARKLLKQASGWENSRIQWLLDLEHRQEMRRARAQLCEEDYVDICCFPFSGNMLMWNTE